MLTNFAAKNLTVLKNGVLLRATKTLINSLIKSMESSPRNQAPVYRSYSFQLHAIKCNSIIGRNLLGFLWRLVQRICQPEAIDKLLAKPLFGRHHQVIVRTLKTVEARHIQPRGEKQAGYFNPNQGYSSDREDFFTNSFIR